MNDEEFDDDDYYEDPPDCGNCKHYPCVGDDLLEEGDGEFEYELCENWEEEMIKEKKTGIERIAAERKRQIDKEGFTAKKDDQWDNGELARAAMCYCMEPAHIEDGDENVVPSEWPWFWEDWKPTPDNRIRELEKAGALIAAEIDRLLRLDKKRLCPICPELSDCPHADNRTECWEYDKAMMKAGEK